MQTYFTSQNYTFSMMWSQRRRPIYRLLDNRTYIDNFFETGEIRLSCFNKFRRYDNEIQGDKNEGRTSLHMKSSEKFQMVFYSSAINSYVLSTTNELSDKNIHDFNAVGAIKINNPTSFGTIICCRIPFCIGGVEGNCKYVESRINTVMVTEEESQNLFTVENYKNMQHPHDLISKYATDDDPFLKEMKYKYQDEYRLIWHVNADVKIQDHIIVHSPEVIPFCEKIIF